MVRSHVGKEASASEKAKIIGVLERVGGVLRPLELAQMINNLFQQQPPLIAVLKFQRKTLVGENLNVHYQQ